jgi:hypothetical protein
MTSALLPTDSSITAIRSERVEGWEGKEAGLTYSSPRAGSSRSGMFAQDMARSDLSRLTAMPVSRILSSKVSVCAWQLPDLFGGEAGGWVPNGLRGLGVVVIWDLLRVGESYFPAGHRGATSLARSTSWRGEKTCIVGLSRVYD